MASRGDRICCTLNFGNEIINDGNKQVPVSFFLNGKKMITKEGEDQFFMDSDKPLYPYIGMTNGCSAWAKVSVKKWYSRCKSSLGKGIDCLDALTVILRNQELAKIKQYSARLSRIIVLLFNKLSTRHILHLEKVWV